MSEDRHVLPVKDLAEHVCSVACWCQPRISEEGLGNRVIIHNSLDGRERREGGKAIRKDS